MALNESIRALRRERGMTQEQLAEAMNVSAAAVSKWENGQSVPDIAMLTALADFYEVSLDALVGYTIHPCRREEVVERIRRPSPRRRRPCGATRTISGSCTTPGAPTASMAWSTGRRKPCVRPSD